MNFLSSSQCVHFLIVQDVAFHSVKQPVLDNGTVRFC